MEQWQADCRLGYDSEISLLEQLREKFNRDIIPCSNYFIFDFQSYRTYYELKTRRCKSTDYKDTMIGLNKITYAQNNYDNKDFLFLFNFTDGLFYWKFDVKEQLNYRMGGRMDRHYGNELKEYCFIPTHLLKKV